MYQGYIKILIFLAMLMLAFLALGTWSWKISTEELSIGFYLLIIVVVLLGAFIVLDFLEVKDKLALNILVAIESSQKTKAEILKVLYEESFLNHDTEEECSSSESVVEKALVLFIKDKYLTDSGVSDTYYRITPAGKERLTQLRNLYRK